MTTRPPSRSDATVRTTDASLWGKTIRTTAGWVTFVREDDDGGAGVREPRRPRPHAPAGAMAIEPEEAFACTEA